MRISDKHSLLIDVLAEIRRRGPRVIKLEELCFPEQLAFLEDKSPFVTAVTSRRAGKTTACALDLLRTAIGSPGVVVLYITLARINASRILWPIIKKLNTDNFLGGDPNETTLSISFPNQSIIYCSGAKDLREVDKFLGLPLKLAYIDEAQSFRPYLEDLIDRVLAPALMDHAGSMKIIGTPGAVPVGTFWEVSQSKQWSRHFWTFFNNPWISLKSGMTHAELLKRELDRRGVTIDDPTIQREFFGKWVTDLNSLVYQYKADANDYTELPNERFTYILGVDLGYNDADALAVLAWNDKSNATYLVEELVTTKQTITALVLQIEQLRAKYDISKITMDMGGLGKKIGEELSRRYRIAVTPAEKIRKFEYIELFNDALRTSRFKAKANSRFAQDAVLMEWDLDKSTPDKKVVSDRFHSDICDAVLYAWRESYSFTHQPTAPKPLYGSVEWGRTEEDQMESYELDKLSKEVENLA